jgi:hypothetical protein
MESKLLGVAMAHVNKDTFYDFASRFAGGGWNPAALILRSAWI